MIILFGNITSTMKIKKALNREGIEAAPIQTTRNPSNPDCGHGLKLDKKYLDKVKEISAELGVKIKGVYHE